MTMSLRQVSTALGFPGTATVSLCEDLVGFARRRCPRRLIASPPPPLPALPSLEFSVSNFVHGLRRAHFSVHLILAGSDLLTESDFLTIDFAVFRLHDIYTRNGIGVGRVTRENRAAANSLGHATVSNSTQLTATGHDLTANGDFVPVVIPANMTVTSMNPDGTVTVTLGRSPTPGPCSPRTSANMNSSVIDIESEETGRTLAHEVGHYLGLNHPATPGTNLMTQTGSVPGGNPFDAISLSADEQSTVRAHCTINNAIPNI